MLRHFSYHRKNTAFDDKNSFGQSSQEERKIYILYSFASSFKIFPTLIFVQTSHNLSARLKLLNLTCK